MTSQFLTVAIAIMATFAFRHFQSPDDPLAPERRRKLRAALPVLIMAASLFYAGLLALAAIALLYGVTLGAEPREPVLFLMIPGLAASSVLFAWIGLRLDRVHSLIARLRRAGEAATAAFFAPDAKPKPEVDPEFD
jgi:ABC-type multidrug transport system fused ATPase/permease subunit